MNHPPLNNTRPHTGFTQHHFYTQRKSGAGFTLLEVVVAITIFSSVLILISSIFTRFVFVERRHIGEQNLQEDIRFAMEQFDREVRTSYGSTFQLSDGTGESLIIRNQQKLCVSYYLDQGKIWRGYDINRRVGTSCSLDRSAYLLTAQPLNSKDTIIEMLRFDPVAAPVGSDGKLEGQGLITIIIRARGLNSAVPIVDMQSTVTSRQVIPYS